jgi:hypothetical protein
MASVPLRKVRFGLWRAALCGIAIGSAGAISSFACSSTHPPVSDGSNTTAPPGTTGPCAVDGAERECHVQLAEHGNVRTCFTGTQTCNAGLWSACGSGGMQTLSSVRLPDGVVGADSPPTQQPGALKPASISTGSADSSACTSNPCDPTCVGFDEKPPDGGITSDASTTATYFSVPFTGTVPAGFFSKGMIDCDQKGVPCQGYVDGKYAACQFDSLCNPGPCVAADAASGSCIQYAEKQALPTTACPGVDLTAGIPCTDNITSEPGMTFTICNRGSSPTLVSTSIGVDFFGGASSAFPPSPGCAKNASPDCRVMVPPLKVGGCFSVRSSSMLAGSKSLSTCQGYIPVGSGPAGNSTVVINSYQAITECGLAPSPYTDGGSASIYKGCDDNWTDLHKSGGNCVGYGKTYGTVVYSQTYTASCPASTKPQWAWLAYNVTTPSSGGVSSTVKFEVRSAPLTADGGTGTFTAFSQAGLAPTPDPANCPLGGPAPCPKDLFVALGGAGAANNEVLDLKITLTPPTDLSVAPTLNSWQVTYSCPPSQ